jgi:hypothetical protein
MPFGNSAQRKKGQETGRGSEPCERRDASDRRESAREGPNPAPVTDRRLLPPDPRAALSRGVERFAERPVSGQAPTIEFPKGIEPEGGHCISA